MNRTFPLFVSKVISSHTRPSLRKLRTHYVLLLIFLSVLSAQEGMAQPATVVTMTANGTFTVPAGVTSITVHAWGGGGGGGGNNCCSGASLEDGGGGGGGACSANNVLTVSPGQIYTVTIGAGGTATTAAGGAGGITTFALSGTTLVSAAGGAGGVSSTANAATGSAAGGLGGATGVTTGGGAIFSGGNGSTGFNTAASGCGTGGSGGGTSGNGLSAANGCPGTTAGGAGTYTGGTGGYNTKCGTTTTSNGVAGGVGGGGGSGTNDFGTGGIGGVGGKGQVAIVYQLPACTPPSLQPTLLSFTPAPTLSTINGTFTAAVSAPAPDGYVIVRYPSGATPTAPANYTTYTAGGTLGTGGNTGTIISVGTATTFAQTGLPTGTAYDFYIYDYYTGTTTTCVGPIYNTTSPLMGTASTNSCATGLSGTLTVGPTGTYATITAAMTAIGTYGLSGPTVIELQTGYTSTLEIFPIVIPSNPCINAAHPLIIRPALGVTGLSITNTGNTHVGTTGTTPAEIFDFNGCNYITIDGRPGGVNGSVTPTSGIFGFTGNLQIINTYVTAVATIRMINDANNNTIEYCDIQGASTTYANPPTAGTIFIGGTTGTIGNDNNSIIYCDVHAAGATLPVTAIGAYNSTTAGSAANNDNLVIDHNNVYDYTTPSTSNATGIYLWLGNNSITLTNNSIYQTATRAINFAAVLRGIWMSPASSAVTYGSANIISNNYIGGSAAQCGGTAMTITSSSTLRMAAMDISVGNGTQSTLSANTIQNIAFTTANTNTGAGGTFSGIYLGYGNAAITNNMIGGSSANNIQVTTTASGGSVTGIGVAGGAAGFTIPITGNTINNITVSSATATVYNSINGIFVTAASPTIQIGGASAVLGNTISNLTAGSSGSTATSTVCIAAGINANAAMPSPVIQYNTIFNIYNYSPTTGNQSTSPVTGIIATSVVTPTISNNTIYNLADLASTTTGVWVQGIYFNVSTTGTGTVSQNLIHSLNIPNFLTTGTGTPIALGIYMGSGGANFTNNMIRLGVDGAGNAITLPIGFIGIKDGTGQAANFYFNSIYIGGTCNPYSTANNSYAFWRSATAGAKIVQDNIFSNVRTNSAANATSLHYVFAATNLTTLTVNNNDYQAASIVGPATGNYMGLNVAANISAYSPNWISGDANSISVDPKFASPAGPAVNTGTLNLDITGPSNIEGAGTLIASITTDYHNNTRSSLTPTDMGADAGNFTVPPVCGALTGGTTTASTTNFPTCPGASTLNLSGATTNASISGLTYQWYVRNPSGTGTWAAISGATGSAYTVTAQSTSDYECILTCSAGGTATSTPVTITVAPFVPTASATAVTAGTITATTIPISWTAAASTPAPSGYLVVQYPTGSAVTAPVNGTTYTAGNALGLGTVGYVGTATSYTASGLAGSSTYDYYVYDYLTGCTGQPGYLTPTTATATFSTSTCNPILSTTDVTVAGTPGTCTVALSLSGNITTTTGYTYQWQQRYPSGSGSFTNIGGATGTSYTAPLQGTTDDYQCLITQTSSGNCAISTPATVTAATTISEAAGYSPVAVSGFNAKLIAYGNNGGNANPPAVTCNTNIGGTIISVDGGGFDFYDASYSYYGTYPALVGNSASTPVNYSLPVNGQVVSNYITGLRYQLVPAATGANTALQVSFTAGNYQTLTLNTPQSGTAVYLLAVSGSGASNMVDTVWFTDGSFQAFGSVSVLDWYTGTNYSQGGFGRVGTGGYDGNANSGVTPYMYDYPLALSSSNYSKLIQKVTIRNTSSTGTGNDIDIFGVTVASPVPSASCPGKPTSITLFNPISAGVTNQWYSSTAQSGPYTAISGATATTYTNSTATGLTYYYAKSTCNNTSRVFNSDTVPITISPAITVAVNPTASLFCSPNTVGDTLKATSTGTVASYAWTPTTGLNSTNTAIVSAMPTATTAYTLTLVSPDGCTATATSTVTVKNAPVLGSITASATPLCPGHSTNVSVAATGTTLAYTWARTPGSVTGAFTGTNTATVSSTPSATALYTVTVTSQGSCPVLDTLTVPVAVGSLAAAPTATGGGVCAGATGVLNANPSGGCPPYSYSWSPAGTGVYNNHMLDTIAPTGTTTYTVTVTDANSATATGSITINVTPLPTIVSSTPGNTCGTSGIDTLRAVSSAGSTIQWFSSVSGGTAIGTGNQFITPTVYVTTSYYAQAVTSSPTCTSAARTLVSALISTPPTITGTTATPPSVCPNNPSQLTVTATLPSSPAYCIPSISNTFTHYFASFALTQGATTIISTNNASAPGTTNNYVDHGTTATTGGLVGGQTYTINGTAAGIYEGLSVWIDYNNNGIFDDGEEVSSVYMNNSTSPIAFTTTTFTVPTSAFNGTTKLRVRDNWAGANGQATPTPRSCGAGNTDGSATYGETDDYTITISGGTNPSGLTYSWTPSATLTGATTSTPIATPTITSGQMVYTVVVTDPNTSCAVSQLDTVKISTGVLTTSITSAGGGATCSNRASYLTAVPGGGCPPYTYSWSPAGLGFNNRINDTVMPASNTTYTVTVSDAGGSTATASYTLTVSVAPAISITASAPSVCGSGSVVLSAPTGTGYSYAWSPTATLAPSAGNTASVTATPAAGTTYTVSVTLPNGCIPTASKTINYYASSLTATASATPPAICSGSNSQLLATATFNQGYTVSSIAYAPITSGSGTTVLESGGTAAVAVTGSLDQGYWPGITIPFSFNFFGNNYTSLAVGTNGNLQFGPTFYTNDYPGTLPGTTELNYIAGGWTDLNDITGSVSYLTSGISPNRVFVVSFNGITKYGSIGSSTFNMELYEGTNVIEVHVTQDSLSTSTGTKQIGINNSTGSQGYAATGRNAQTYTVSGATPEAWRFTPVSPAFTYAWSPTTYLNSASIANPLATGVAATTPYTVTVTEATSGCKTTVSDPVTIATPSALSVGAVTGPSTTVCVSSMSTLSVSPGGGCPPYNYTWSPSGVGTNHNALDSVMPSATTTYSVTVTDFSGSTAATSYTLTVTNPSVTSTTPGSICTPSGTVTLGATASSGTINWYAASTGGTALTTGNSYTTPTITATTTYYASANVTTPITCASVRVPVVASVSPPALTLNVSATSTCGGAAQALTVTSSTSNFTSYIWTPTAGLYTDAAATIAYTGSSATTVYALPTANTTYTLNASGGSCTNTASAQVNAYSGTAIAINSTTCAGSGDIIFTSGRGAGMTTVYQNNFSSSVGAATLSGSAAIATVGSVGSIMELTGDVSGQTGAMQVPQASNANILHTEFDLELHQIGQTGLYANLQSDGLSYSFGNTAAALSTANEYGLGYGLKVCFDLFDGGVVAWVGNNGTHNHGTYLVYGNALGTTSGAEVVAFNGHDTIVSPSTTVGAANHITIDVDAAGKCTVKYGTHILFNNVQLPSAWLTDNKAGWAHTFAARTGGNYTDQGLDNLLIQTGTLQFGVNNANWQVSNVFANLPANTYTLNVRDANNTSCTASVGSVTIATNSAGPAPVVAPVVPQCPETIQTLTSAAVVSNSDTLYKENFNYGLGLFSSTNTSTSNGDYFHVAQAPDSSQTFLTGYSVNGTPFAFANALNANAATGTAVYNPTKTMLISPVINLANTVTDTLRFQHYYNYSANDNTANVGISTDGGLTYTTLKGYFALGVSQGSAAAPANEVISLNAYAGMSVMIRFNYSSGSTSSFGGSWAIDNFLVTGKAASPTLVWAPTSGIYTDAAATVAYTGGNATTVYVKPTVTTVYIVSTINPLTGCTKSTLDTVKVNPRPTAHISGVYSGICAGVAEPYQVSFTGSSPWHYTIDTAGGVFSGTTYTGSIVFTMTPHSAKTIKVTALSDTNCVSIYSDLDSANLTVNNNCPLTWTGTTSTDWNTSSNWSPPTSPNSCLNDVTIAAGTPFSPTVNTAVQVGNLTVIQGQTVTLNSNLSICKDLMGQYGVNFTGAGKLIFNGSTVQNLTGQINASEVLFANTSAVPSSNVVFTNYTDLNVTRGVTLQTGNVNATTNNAEIRLISNSLDTVAWLNDFGSNTGSFTGQLRVERLVAATGGVSWQHDASSPVDNTIFHQMVGQAEAPYGYGSGAYLIPSSNCSEDSISRYSPYSSAFTWNESNVSTSSPCVTTGWKTVAESDTNVAGKGYSMYMTSGTKFNLYGRGNTGDINVDGCTNSGWTFSSPATASNGTAHTDNSGWSMVGNPYPSGLDLSTSRIAQDFDDAVQVYHPIGTYTGTYTPVQLSSTVLHLAPFQGFMVHKHTVGGTASWPFYQSERTTNVGANYHFYKESENALNIQVSGNGFADMTRVEFNSNATEGYDSYDAEKFRSLKGQPTLFTTIAGFPMWAGINTQGSIQQATVVPMGLEPGANGSFTLSVSQADLNSFNAAVNIYLEDKQSNAGWINLRTTPSYTFTSATTDDANRFALHFSMDKTTGITAVSGNTDINIFAVNNHVMVDFSRLKTVDATIQVYDILGQQLSSEQHHSTDMYSHALASVEAAYVIVMVREDNGQITTKKLFLSK